MFERFTDRARWVIVMAQNDAREFGHGSIQPAHLLLALREEEEGVAARALTSVGADPVVLRAAVASAFQVTAARTKVERLPFSPRAKKVLELSLREALQLGHRYIGTEHLLLGVLRLTSTEDPDVEELFGLHVKRLRKAVLTTMTGMTGASRGGGFSPALARAMERGRSLAGRAPTTTGHLLLAMVDDPECQAARALGSLGAGRDALARAISEVPVGETTDAPPEAIIEVHVAGRSLRVTDAELAARLSSVRPEELLGALRRAAGEVPEDPPSA